MELALIAAVDGHNGIGRDGKQPPNLTWAIDRQIFQALTGGCTTIMGRKTAEAIRAPLKFRDNLVLTKNSYNRDGFKVISSITEGLMYSRNNRGPEARVYVIGGGEIYRQTINHADILYITKYTQDLDCDTFFPDIDESLWMLVAQQELFKPMHGLLHLNTYRRRS